MPLNCDLDHLPLIKTLPPNNVEIYANNIVKAMKDLSVSSGPKFNIYVDYITDEGMEKKWFPHILNKISQKIPKNIHLKAFYFDPSTSSLYLAWKKEEAKEENHVILTCIARDKTNISHNGFFFDAKEGFTSGRSPSSTMKEDYSRWKRNGSHADENVLNFHGPFKIMRTHANTNPRPMKRRRRD
jgi:hypothetical protein